MSGATWIDVASEWLTRLLSTQGSNETFTLAQTAVLKKGF